MARGPSGRLVIEVDPSLKRDLHSALAADGSSLKDWFLKRVAEYFAERHQPVLPGITRLPGAAAVPTLRAAEEAGSYRTSKSSGPAGQKK
jgi:hypothetical protein